MFICKPKQKFCRTRKGLGTSLDQLCYVALVSSGVLSKVALACVAGGIRERASGGGAAILGTLRI